MKKTETKLIAWNKKFCLLAFLILHSVYLQPVYSAVYHNEPVPNKLSEAAPDALWTVPVVVIRFIPRSGDGELLDPVKAPDYYHPGKTPYNEKKNELDRGLIATRFYRQEGTRYRAYSNPDAAPSITYPVLAVYTVEDLPPASSKFYSTNKRGEKVAFPDWFKIMQKINGKRWVEKKGVREFWVWSTHYEGIEPSYDPAVIPKANFRALAESNMSSRSGDISNSSRADDLPVYKNTYTVYQYNLHRSVNENIHNHIHQIEHLLNHIEGRERTPKSEWNKLLFWGKFVGSDTTHKLTEPRRCGWGHFPPNADKAYDYSSEKIVLSDIEDWTPDGSGNFKEISADHWGKVEADWHLLWMQSLPGRNNKLSYKNRKLRNWWSFIGDWNKAVKNGYQLVK